LATVKYNININKLKYKNNKRITQTEKIK